MSGLDMIAAPAASSAPPPPQAPTSGWGLRNDGTAKGDGYFGPLPNADGSVSTELSVGVEIDGKEMDIPTIVPTLSRAELDHLSRGGRPTDQIVDKAVDFARQRMKAGMSPFASPGERYPLPEK
jgi:hypothetical protein